MTSLRGRIEQLLKIAPDSKPAVYLEVFNSSEIISLNYALELLFSSGIATFGLVLNSPAVVIGAMLIRPSWVPFWRPDWRWRRRTCTWESSPC
jgi:hypothetical protein